jgi:hypothetical protein
VVDSASNRNEYMEYFMGHKGNWCLGLTTLHLHVSIDSRSGILSLLELSGHVISLNRNIFTFTFTKAFISMDLSFFTAFATYPAHSKLNSLR